MKSTTMSNLFKGSLLKKQSKSNRVNKTLFYLIALLSIGACTSVSQPNSTEEPTLSEFRIGETWVWHWERSVDGEIQAEGEDFQEVVDFDGTLGFWNGFDTILITSTLNQKSSTPFRDWPLKIGKKWKYESSWENDEGTTGTTSQDVEVVSFEEVTVAAGKFMAYKLEYRGTIVNSRGFNGEMKDDWWYAPALKTYIRHVNDDGYGIYINELIAYSSAPQQQSNE